MQEMSNYAKMDDAKKRHSGNDFFWHHATKTIVVMDNGQVAEVFL